MMHFAITLLYYFYCCVEPLASIYSLLFSLSCVCVALVVPASKLEQLGSYSPRVHGLPHLRRGQSTTAEVHSQAWQVRKMHVCVCTHMYAQPRVWSQVVSVFPSVSAVTTFSTTCLVWLWVYCSSHDLFSSLCRRLCVCIWMCVCVVLFGIVVT